MVVKPLENNFAPYSSAISVLSIIERFRDRGLPDPLTMAALEQVGIKPSMTSFTLRSLVFLGLIDDAGNISPAFHQLRQAPENDYPNSLAEIIRKAYLRVFTVADPAADDEVADAFRVYEPANQRAKMIRLFKGLCAKAGLIPSASVKQRKATPRHVTPRVNPNSGRQTPAPPPPQPPTAPNTQQEVVQLTSGGKMTISLETNVWQLSPTDETFILDIKHRIREYNQEKGNQSQIGPTEASVSQDGAG